MIYTLKPKRIAIYINSARKTMAQVKAETGCDAIVNGGLFNMSTFRPVGHLRADGVTLATEPYTDWGYGWDAGRPRILHSDRKGEVANYINCVCLVRDGKAEGPHYNAEMGGARERSAIGVYPDGRIWLYCDKAGATPEFLQMAALNAGLESALMLDGGGSTQGIFPNGSVTSTRIVHNYICLWADNTGKKGDGDMKVCLDAGHGGTDTSNGAPDGTYKEHEFTHDMQGRIKALLTRHGIGVMTNGNGLSLTGRATAANTAKADLFVSLHSNAISGGWGTPSGLCVYTYASGASAKRNIAAQLLIDQMEKAGVKLFGQKLYHSNFTVLSKTAMPAYLIEYGFHTNKGDVALLKDSAYRDKLAIATAKAVCDYFGIKWVEDKPAEPEPAGKIYRVQVGAFTTKAYAEALERRLRAEGYDTILKAEG